MKLPDQRLPSLALRCLAHLLLVCMQAYSTTAILPADGLALASDVADAQPAASSTSLSSSSHVTPANAVAPSSHSEDQSPSNSQPDLAALVGTAGDELEQDSKAVLKAGDQNEALAMGMQGSLQPKHDEKAHKAQQEAFAAATLEAFRRKLFMQGCEGHSIMEVEQLVDELIGQATSLDTLCQMYEGWTAWI